MNRNINFKYGSETHDKYHATLSLDCYEYAVANGIKSKFGNEINMYDIFAKDITFCMAMDKENNIGWGMSQHPNPHINVTIYENSTLEMLEQFLDNNEIILINTLHHEIKFFKYYNTPYSTENGMPVHWLSIVHHDSENLYFVENPDLVNPDNYTYYAENKTVGMISKEYMKPFFDRYLVCLIVHIDFDEPNVFTENLFEILQNTVASFEKKNSTNEICEFYGIAALEKMVEICSGNDEVCYNKHTEELSSYLVDATRVIFQIRIYMKECLMLLAENRLAITKDEIFEAFEPAIETWIMVRNIFTKKHIRKQPLLDKHMVRYFSSLMLYEKRIVECMAKILEQVGSRRNTR